ncbi:hypothetical protein BDV27DRAFT_156724 [Aspergillus caelatus]|uniref:Uncharacterized protein n=1 Tax=Aspergillus caelatus TaxID=61420 RepID=A0A5N7A7P6_9EURO|nr:uncharacterized protein BDV27DRAFT_156724 [Aspergillus caelatus]KAE8365633.1 hypothetical protein BDV27DRAFT_156724 [Aspergillus caelatus]
MKGKAQTESCFLHNVHIGRVLATALLNRDVGFATFRIAQIRNGPSNTKFSEDDIVPALSTWPGVAFFVFRVLVPVTLRLVYFLPKDVRPQERPDASLRQVGIISSTTTDIHPCIGGPVVSKTICEALGRNVNTIANVNMGTSVRSNATSNYYGYGAANPLAHGEKTDSTRIAYLTTWIRALAPDELRATTLIDI